MHALRVAVIAIGLAVLLTVVIVWIARMYKTKQPKHPSRSPAVSDVSTFEAAVGPVSADSVDSVDPLARLLELKTLLHDPQQTFSISQTLSELDRLETQLDPLQPHARSWLLYLRNFVLGKADRYEEGLPCAIASLRAQQQSPFLSDNEALNFGWQLAEQAKHVGDWSTAIEALRLSVAASDAVGTPNQQLAIREQLAFCLHEAEAYEQAMELNQCVLKEGEQLLGNDSDKLFTVLTNLAQNAYVLGLRELAQNCLERRLELAQKHDCPDQLDDSLFQLSMLAYESGDSEKALALMQRRLSLAQSSQDLHRITKAQDGLAILREKLQA